MSVKLPSKEEIMRIHDIVFNYPREEDDLKYKGLNWFEWFDIYGLEISKILDIVYKEDEYQKELKEVLRKFGDNEYYNLDGDMEILYDEDKKWYLRYDSGYGKLEIKFRTVKNLIKDREKEEEK